MSIRLSAQRSRFFSELSPEDQQKFFNLTRDKVYPTIDNIYYVVYLNNDSNDNPAIDSLLKHFAAVKEDVFLYHKPLPCAGLMMSSLGYSGFKYCLSEPDMFDIFFCETLVDEEKNPRVMIQIRSYGLWIHGVDNMLNASYKALESVLSGEHLPFDVSLSIKGIKENRIDWCYHINTVQNPEKMFDFDYFSRYLQTDLRKWEMMGDIRHMDEHAFFERDYVLLGRKKSNNVVCRLYNKSKEIIQKAYKGFFLDFHYNNGLISFYDKWVYEQAYIKKSWEYVDKARLMFYLQFGTDEAVKKEFNEALNPKTLMSHERIKKLADSYMPPVTVVWNIEYQTMRKFFSRSDAIIDSWSTFPRENVPRPLERLYKITDNRAEFLDVLTRDTVSFVKRGADGKRLKVDGEPVYCNWWKRLRNTTLESLPLENKFYRVYEHELDEKRVIDLAVSRLATAAVYRDDVDSDFLDDVLAFMASINDNDKREVEFRLVNGGEVVTKFWSVYLNTYYSSKVEKEARLKNRKRQRAERQAAVIEQIALQGAGSAGSG